MRTKNIIRVAAITASILLIPFVAMQFTSEVQWTISDFLVAAVVLFGIGLSFVWLMSRSTGVYYRLGAGLSVATTLLLVWSNLAVGFIGSGPNAANLMYGGMLAIGIVGSISARFRAAGMVYTMFAMALAQVLVPLVALSFWQSDIELFRNPGEAGAIAIITGIFVMLWIGAGLLFRRADHLSSGQAGA